MSTDSTFRIKRAIIDLKQQIELVEPSLYTIVAISKGITVCESAITYAIEVVLTKDIAIAPGIVITDLNIVHKAICLKKPITKDLAETYSLALTTCIKEKTLNNTCFCGTRIEFDVVKVNEI